MHLEINLASQPYEDARQFWLRWGTALTIATIVTLALIAIAVSGCFAARRDHAMTASSRAQIAQRDRTRQQAEAYLNKPENRTTRDESQFLNNLIERKSLSWTRVLEDLEKVMPARVHLISIRPAIGDENQLMLKLVVAGDSRDRAIELAQRMEESHRFSETYIQSEHFTPVGSGDRFEFDISGVYLPQIAAELAPPPKAGTAKRSNP